MPGVERAAQPTHEVMSSNLGDIQTDSEAPPETDNEKEPLIAPAVEGEEDEEEDEEQMNYEKLAFGSIASHVYTSYIRAVGLCLAAWVIISLTLMQGKV